MTHTGVDAHDPYDAVAYESTARSTTHPGSVFATAHLLGRPLPDLAALRVLELGCGDGGNLLPMALDLPGGTFVGVDLAANPIKKARRAAQELSASNAEFVQADIRFLPSSIDGPFDLIVAHGLYSWVPAAERNALLQAIATSLDPAGVAFVSYNTYPGSYLRDAVRDALRYSVGELADPGERLARSKETLRFLASAGLDGEAHRRAVASYAAELLTRPDWLLFHDELGAINDAVYFHEFVAHAESRGLAWLFESHLGSGLLSGVTPEAASFMKGVGPDVVRQEQLRDHLTNRLFRESLLVKGPIAANTREIDVTRAQSMFVCGQIDRTGPHAFTTADGSSFTVPDAAIAEVLTAIGQSFPQDLAVEGLVPRGDRQALEALLDLHARRVVELSVLPSAVTDAGAPCPYVNAFARWRVQHGHRSVPNGRHRDISLDDALARQLVLLLDGTRTRAQIARTMGQPLREVEAAIARLSSTGLLARPTPSGVANRSDD